MIIQATYFVYMSVKKLRVILNKLLKCSCKILCFSQTKLYFFLYSYNFRFDHFFYWLPSCCWPTFAQCPAPTAGLPEASECFCPVDYLSLSKWINIPFLHLPKNIIPLFCFLNSFYTKKRVEVIQKYSLDIFQRNVFRVLSVR